MSNDDWKHIYSHCFKYNHPGHFENLFKFPLSRYGLLMFSIDNNNDYYFGIALDGISKKVAETYRVSGRDYTYILAKCLDNLRPDFFQRIAEHDGIIEDIYAKAEMYHELFIKFTTIYSEYMPNYFGEILPIINKCIPVYSKNVAEPIASIISGYWTSYTGKNSLFDL